MCVRVARGNTSVCGEFNFVADPEAAYVVLDKYHCPTYIAPWEFSCRNSLPWVSNTHAHAGTRTCTHTHTLSGLCVSELL